MTPTYGSFQSEVNQAGPGEEKRGPDEDPGDEEREVLELMQPHVVEGGVIERRQVPDDEAGHPERQREERPDDPARPGEAEHDEERADVANDQVLDHVGREPARERRRVHAHDEDGSEE